MLFRLPITVPVELLCIAAAASEGEVVFADAVAEVAAVKVVDLIAAPFVVARDEMACSSAGQLPARL